MEDKKVIIYSGTNCSHCEAAKQYFYDNAIEYEEHNINEDKKAKIFLLQKGVMSVPFIIINKQEFIGFIQSDIEKALFE